MRTPSAGLVMSEFTAISVIGVFVAVSWEIKRATEGNLPTGIR
jgi:hypothetical protein